MPFDVAGARNEGYTDDEIQSHLEQYYDVAGAVSEGYTLEDIGQAVKLEPVTPPEPQPEMAEAPPVAPAPQANAWREEEIEMPMGQVTPEIQPPPEPIKQVGKEFIQNTVAAARGLAGKAFPVAEELLIDFPARVVSGMQNVVQNVDHLDKAWTAFKEGYAGKEEDLVNIWEKEAEDFGKILAGEPKTKGEAYQHWMADNIVNAALITWMGKGLVDLGFQVPAALKRTASETIGKATDTIDALRKVKLKPEELYRVKRAIQTIDTPMGVESLAKLNEKQRVFYNAILKDASRVAKRDIATTGAMTRGQFKAFKPEGVVKPEAPTPIELISPTRQKLPAKGEEVAEPAISKADAQFEKWRKDLPAPKNDAEILNRTEAVKRQIGTYNIPESGKKELAASLDLTLDEVKGLPTRKIFVDAAYNAKESGREFAIIYMDILNQKGVNEFFKGKFADATGMKYGPEWVKRFPEFKGKSGEEAANIVLRKLADDHSGVVRANKGEAYRVGGDEDADLLLDASMKKALEIKNQIRAKNNKTVEHYGLHRLPYVREANMPAGGGTYNIGVSHSSEAVTGRTAEDVDKLISLANERIGTDKEGMLDAIAKREDYQKFIREGEVHYGPSERKAVPRRKAGATGRMERVRPSAEAPRPADEGVGAGVVEKAPGVSKPKPKKPPPKEPPDLAVVMSEERNKLLAKPTNAQLEVFEADKARPMQKVRDVIYDKLGFGAKARVPAPAKAQYEEAVKNIQLKEFEAARYANFVKRHLPAKKDREALTFFVEKTNVPKQLARPDLEKIVSEKSPKMVKMANIAKRHSDLTWKYMQDNLPNLDAEAIENYVTHIWDIPKNKISEAVSWFVTRNPFLKKRFINTYKEGIEKGYKPKTLDYAEITAIHDRMAIRSTENTKLVGGLKALENEAGVKLIQRADQAPADWIPVDHPAMRKAAMFKSEVKETVPMDVRKALGMDSRKVMEYIDKKGNKRVLSVPRSVAELKAEGVETKSVTIQTMGTLPVKVAPELEPLMKAVFGKKIKMPVSQIYETFNALMKKTQLSISLFHHTALSETAVATIGPARTANILFNAKKIYKALARNEYSVYKKHKWSEDAIKDGLQLGAITDVHRTKVNQILQEAEAKLKGLSKVAGLPATFIRKANTLWDKGLWDYLHNELKLIGHHTLKTKAIARLKKPTQKQIDAVGEEVAKQQQIDAAGKEVAQFVNDTFGGQNWERMMTNPQTLQVAQWSLLSADWTYSTIRQGLAPTGIGAVAKESAKLRRSMGMRFWRNAVLYFGVGMNALNFALTKSDNAEQRDLPWKQGQGKFMWQNDPGHKTHLFAGRYEDGTKRYVRWGKQFREVPEMIYDQMAGEISPISASTKKIGGKLAPFWQVTSQIFTGASLGGFRNREIANKNGWSWVGGVAKTMIRMPLPFSTRSVMDMKKEFKFTDLVAPSSKGMSYFKARKMFKSAIAHRNEKMIEGIFRAAVENKLNAFDIFEAAVTELKSEASGEARRLVREKKDKEPETLRGVEAQYKEKERQEETKFILNNWDIAISAAKERYKAYLTEEELLGEKIK